MPTWIEVLLIITTYCNGHPAANLEVCRHERLTCVKNGMYAVAAAEDLIDACLAAPKAFPTPVPAPSSQAPTAQAAKPVASPSPTPSPAAPAKQRKD